ncbi:hypothetical protein KCU65_g101, partial [Aureobasidium melanogenum]
LLHNVLLDVENFVGEAIAMVLEKLGGIVEEASRDIRVGFQHQFLVSSCMGNAFRQRTWLCACHRMSRQLP